MNINNVDLKSLRYTVNYLFGLRNSSHWRKSVEYTFLTTAPFSKYQVQLARLISLIEKLSGGDVIKNKQGFSILDVDIYYKQPVVLELG